MSWHFLQEGVEASWQQSCLDGAPSALLNLMPEQEEYCLTGSEMECLNRSQYGMTFKHLTDDHGAESLMLSQEDSRAKTLANADLVKESTAKDQDYGWKWQESFAKFDHVSFSWKTRQCSLLEDSEKFLETWPQWGCMRSGECSELPALEQLIIEPGFSWLLTPTAQSWKAWTFRNPFSLIRKNHADGNLQEQLMRLYQRMTTPRCQEILMMWPEGWTDSKPLETDKFHCALQQHGEF